MNLAKLAQILLVSLALSAYATWLLSTREEAAAPRTRPGIPATDIPLLRTAEARALWDKSSTLFVDVRSPADFAFGHISGALNLPEEDFTERLPKLQAKLEHAKAVVVYCKSRDCGKSLWLALRLRQRGLTQTMIYPAGWNEWFLRGFPAEHTTPR